MGKSTNVVCKFVKKKMPKSGREGGNGLQPTMGLEGGPAAWWRTRMLPPFTVLSVDKVEAAAGQPAAARGPATSRPPGGAQTTSTLTTACHGDAETAVVTLRRQQGNSVRY